MEDKMRLVESETEMISTCEEEMCGCPAKEAREVGCRVFFLLTLPNDL